MRHLVMLSCLALAACDPPVKSLPPIDGGGPAPTVIAGAPDACGAAGLQVLVGQDVALFESQARTGPQRILRPGQAVTSDFSATRVNVTVDRQNRITRVACG